MLFLGTLIISFLCIYSYIKTRKAYESLLNFTLALLTLFTIGADTAKTLIFVISYSLVTIVIIMISSVRLYMGKETILFRASFELYGNDNKQKQHIKELMLLEKQSDSILLDPKEKSEIVLFFAQRKLDPKLYPQLIKLIDDFKVGANLSLMETCEIMHILFKIIELPVNYAIDIPLMMDTLYDNQKSLPIGAQSYYQLIISIQDAFWKGENNAIDILTKLGDLIQKGFTTNYIISKMLQ